VTVTLASATPALPATDVARSRDFYVETIGFDVVAEDEGFALLRKDEATVSLWGATDDTWRTRTDWTKPVQSGAETFIAGTASCAFETSGADELYERCNALGFVHPNAHIEDTDWGTREFAVLDPDGNLVRFWERRA
jgi:catechol 2,3-dioxygenase-like lactoylglutathione lyase family enzyme